MAATSLGGGPILHSNLTGLVLSPCQLGFSIRRQDWKLIRTDYPVTCGGTIAKSDSTDRLATCAMIHAILLDLQPRARQFKTSALSHAGLFSVISLCSKADFNFGSDGSRCIGSAQQKIQTLICLEIRTHTASSKVNNHIDPKRSICRLCQRLSPTEPSSSGQL